tara:strand:+ start:577 stop:852 length:276 start_codon:yes stop_codon:yes gene_type:complete
MELLANYSDSLIGSLCREVEHIRNRQKRIKESLKTCLDKQLILRLNKELKEHQNRSKEILNFSQNIKHNSNRDDLCIDFLYEISNRQLTFF